MAKRPWLLEDLQRLPIAGQVSGRRLIACPGANLGVEDPLGPDVLAGVLAGARRDMDRGHEWLIVPRSDELQALLEAWCIADHGMTPRGQRRVSPFYGALLAAEMPLTTAASILGIHRAGGCPLLAWCYWEVAYGGQNYPYPPRAWALPWAGGPATLKRAHWGRWSLHREAARLGIAHVPRCLKKRLNHW
ncbi:hypothetical protein HQ590_14140 [bacterium]|nr:hypothetical protein [bacterium]